MGDASAEKRRDRIGDVEAIEDPLTPEGEIAKGCVSMIAIEIWFDGCCEPTNPGGHAGYGAIVMRGSDVLWQFSGYIPPAETTSNNVGEYSAFIAALEWLKVQGLNRQPVLFRGDSMLVIKQMFGRWQIRHGYYVPFAHKAKKMLEEFPNTTGEWIPREQNSLADALSKAELVKRNIKFVIQPEK